MRYIQNHMLEPIPLQLNQTNITMDIYNQIYTFTTIKELLHTIKNYQHNYFPIFGNIQQLITDTNQQGFTRIIPIRYNLNKQKPKNKIQYRYKINTTNDNNEEYQDNILITTTDYKIPYKWKRTTWKQLYEFYFNTKFNQEKIFYPSGEHSLKWTSVNNNLLQLTKEYQNNLPSDYSERKDYFYFPI